ncbi:MAG: hypothetical protein HY744_08390 [Deltaproteobacteria bacterium]|nr:hypothetical protein [Deltaproteobacteria bacterium]
MRRHLLPARETARSAAAPLLRLLALVLALGVAGCPKTDQSLVLVGGSPVSAAVIDADPLAVLPGGALLLGRLDAAVMFRSGVGSQVGEIASNLLPLGPESNFVPSRDVRRLWGAIYAMQGADFCAVLEGSFDAMAIQAAAERRAQTPSGLPIVRTAYAGNDMYTVSNLGFVLLTEHTILSGNETAMRRALERLRRGNLERVLPPWMLELLGPEQAAFALAGDLSSQAAVEATAQQLPFLGGLRLVRVLGNFRPPGANVVGTLGYADEQAAAAGAQGLRSVQQLGYIVSLISSFGLGGQMPPMTVAQKGQDVAFAAEIDASALSLLTSMAAQATRPAATAGRPWYGR